MINLTRLRCARMAMGDPITGEHRRWGAWGCITPAVVVTPHSGAIYSNAWIDLTRESYLPDIPHTDGRYGGIQCCDLFDTSLDLPGRRTAPGKTVVALARVDSGYYYLKDRNNSANHPEEVRWHRLQGAETDDAFRATRICRQRRSMTRTIAYRQPVAPGMSNTAAMTCIHTISNTMTTRRGVIR
jgi:hypothetical protein